VQRAFSRNLGKSEAITVLLVFPTTYAAEQGFSQILHMRKKTCNRLDMNKNGGNVTGLKLTSLQPHLKKLADKHQSQGLH